MSKNKNTIFGSILLLLGLLNGNIYTMKGYPENPIIY
jgi:hypothetical protein